MDRETTGSGNYTGWQQRCPNCNAVLPYHNHPCNGGGLYQLMPHSGGCLPSRQLTEDDVRRIVREELAKHPEPLTLRTIGGKP